ncbi:MAG TPA: hypothetical protein VMV57_03740 [Terracidiphilus sp.]|nr:hypothetical protein [Terracidiphilus sp.]
MKKSLQLAVILLALCPFAAAQVEPAASGGPHAPVLPKSLDYSLRYAHTMEFGKSLGNWQNSTISGSLSYTNGRERFPFSMEYGGGYSWNITGPAYGNGAFHRLQLSQGFTGRLWNLLVSDNVSYSPEAPTLGFTGIPGIGEPVGAPPPSPTPPAVNGSILTLNTHVVNNTVNGSLEHRLNYAMSMNLGGDYNVFRFPDGNGLDINSEGANGGLNWRLNGRNSLLTSYRFSEFTYPDYLFSFYTHSGNVGFERLWSRRISTTVTAGPQWTSSSNSSLVPDSLGVAVNAMLNYHSGFNNFSLSYARGVNNGGGFLIGAETDTATANYSRRLGNAATLGFTASYMRTAGLLNNGVTNAKYGGAEATRRLGNHLQVFANYSLIAQSSSSQLPGNTLGQVIQVVGFGIGYSPRRREPTQ